MNNRFLYGMFYDLMEQSHEVFRTGDGLAVLSPRAPLWIWLAQGCKAADARLFFSAFLQENGEQFKSESLVGLISENEAALACADLYARKTGLSYTLGELVAYYLPPDTKLPDGTAMSFANGRPDSLGGLRPAGSEDWPLIREWIKAFYSETLHAVPPQMGQNPRGSDLEAVGPEAVAKVSLFTWWDERPVAMGMLTGPTGQICRLNLVYTPPDLCGRGYGRALVSALCKLARENGQIPMLYTSGDNAASNGLYKSLGFQEAGRLTEVRFV